MTRVARLAPIAVTVCATLLAQGCRASPRRGALDFDRMRDQQRYSAYQARPAFATGTIEQTPPAGTIARDDTAPVAVATGMTGGKAIAEIPLVIDSALLANGARQYAISCAVCHGVAGFGGSVVAANLVDARPGSLRSAAVRALPAGVLYDMVSHGRGRMPAYDWQLTPRDRWAVIAYLRELQRTSATSTLALADSAAADQYRRVDSMRAAVRGIEGAAVARAMGPPHS